jgi:hypothetical protein
MRMGLDNSSTFRQVFYMVEVARIELASEASSGKRPTCVVCSYRQQTRLSGFVPPANLGEFLARIPDVLKA